jgi:hypothetical protein
MATLNYWIAVSNDSECYSLIGKTKKEILAHPDYRPSEYETPIKKSFYYKDAFDLFDFATSEGGGRNMGTVVN